MAEEIVGVKLQVDPGDSTKTVGEFREELAAAVNDAKKIGEAFGRNSTQFKAAQDHAEKVGSALQEASAAAVKLGDGVKKAEAPLSGMRTQLRAAVENLIQVQTEFGDISPEAQKAARAVADLRDRIKDANEVSSLFDPEKKFQAIVGVTQGIASGFAAAQGAMALFGAESEEVQKSILKVQAAMSLAQGLSGIKAAAEDFKRLGALIQTTAIYQKGLAAANAAAAATMKLLGISTDVTSFSFKALRAAIITTGIGALVVVIGYAINAMNELSLSTDSAAEAQENLKNKARAAQAELNDIGLKAIDRQQALDLAKAKAAGASEQQLTDIQDKFNELRKKKLDDNRSRLAQGTEERAAADAALTDEINRQELARLDAQAQKREEAQKKVDEAAAKAKTTRDKAAAEDKKADEKRLEQEAAIPDRIKEQGRRAQELAAEQQKAFDDNLASEADKAMAAQDAQTKLENDHADARKQIAEREADAKVAAAQSVSQALMGFAALAGEQTQAGKLFAAASATIQGILGAQQAFTAMSAIPIVGPALGAIAAAGAIAGAIANVRKIYAVPIPGQGSGGGGGSLPSISSTAPISPQRPQSAPVKIDQDSLNNMGNATVRAYVVESDITSKQDRIKRIQNAAKFG